MPTTLGKAIRRSGSAYRIRRIVERLTGMPTRPASRAPARPARARPIPARTSRKRSVRRPCRRVRPGICSANVLRGQVGSSHQNGRTRRTRTVSRPPEARSEGERMKSVQAQSDKSFVRGTLPRHQSSVCGRHADQADRHHCVHAAPRLHPSSSRGGSPTIRNRAVDQVASNARLRCRVSPARPNIWRF